MIHPRSFPALLLAVLTVAAATAFGQGALTPPGAPAPTMKTLDQVEARVPIPGGTSTYTINADGTYYLTGNLIVSSGDGLHVNANNVSVDLNGYSIVSTAATAASTGVYFGGNGSLRVRNGHLRGATTFDSASGNFTTHGFALGVYASGGASVRVEDLDVIGVSLDGINSAAANTVVVRCQATVCARHGISAPLLGSSVDHCVCVTCGGDGIDGGTVADCTGAATGAGTGIAARVASNCSASSGTGAGFNTSTANNCYGSSGGAGIGLGAATAQGCYGESGSGTGLNSLTAVNCYGHSTSGAGVSATNAQTCSGESGTGVGLTVTDAANCTGITSATTVVSGIEAVNVTNCKGAAVDGLGINTQTAADSSGSSTATSGIKCVTAKNCVGVSATNGVGILASASVADCMGQSSSGAGISTRNVANSYGTANSGVGIACSDATNCNGQSNSGAGLTCKVAQNCFGFTSGLGNANAGINCGYLGVAIGCYGQTGNPPSIPLVTTLAIGCVTDGQTGPVIDHKYDMP